MNRREVLMRGAVLSLLGTRAFAQGAKEVAIGAIWPLTGASAQVGVDAKHALETAVEIVNGSFDINLPTAKNAGIAGLGGAKIKLIFADHQGDPQKGRAEAERLITQDKVCAILGAFHSSVSSTVRGAAFPRAASMIQMLLRFAFRTLVAIRRSSRDKSKVIYSPAGPTGCPVPPVREYQLNSRVRSAL